MKGTYKDEPAEMPRGRFKELYGSASCECLYLVSINQFVKSVIKSQWST